MPARAIYKASIRFGGFTVPVKLYTAVGDIRVHFRLLHGADGVPLQREMVCPLDGERVPSEHRLKGYPVARDEYVVLTADELDAIAPESDRTIEVTASLPAGAIDARWLERTYYLGADGKDDAYAALAGALADGRMALCRWRMRRRDYVGALTTGGDLPRVLLLITLRHAGEVVPADRLELAGGGELREKELKTARWLVEELAADFHPADYRDQRRERLLTLLRQKAEGRTIEILRPVEKPATPEDRLLEQLEASLAAVRHG
jgi:DNA end-binding protein Ku